MIMRVMPKLLLLLVILALFGGCITPASDTRPHAVVSSVAGGKALHEAGGLLADKLVASVRGGQVGKIAVADLIGPGEGITGLGEYLSDKASLALYSSGQFQEIMERKQLKQIILSHREELSGYFDPSTVKQFGKMIGVDAMVIGIIRDAGDFFDVTAKIVESETGRIRGMADVQLLKDGATATLVSEVRYATLTILVAPPVKGKVLAGGKESHLSNGTATFSGVPFGDCPIVIQPEGYDSVRKVITIRSRTETFSVSLEEKLFEVSFQVSPPDAVLTLNGEVIALNAQGFAKVGNLKMGPNSYTVRAKGYQEKLGSFDPAFSGLITVSLLTSDPFYATKAKFFEKVQQLGARQDFTVDLKTDRKTYRIGDLIYFHFRTHRDCYLNLVNITSDGEIRLLFPNRFHPDNFVRAGVWHRIPDERYGFAFEVEPPIGTDRVYAIAGTRPFKVFEPDFRQESFHTLTRGNTRAINVKGIGEKLDQANLNAAAEWVIEVKH